MVVCVSLVYKVEALGASLARCVWSDLDVKAELLKAFEEGLLVAGHKRFHVRVDGRAHLSRLFLDLQLNAEETNTHTHTQEVRI